MNTKMIPDPMQLLDAEMSRLMDEFVDENTCIECGKKVNYELYCMSPVGVGPMLCAECAGIKHDS